MNRDGRSCTTMASRVWFWREHLGYRHFPDMILFCIDSRLCDDTNVGSFELIATNDNAIKYFNLILWEESRLHCQFKNSNSFTSRHRHTMTSLLPVALSTFLCLFLIIPSHASPCLVFDSNFVLYVFGLGGKDYSLGSQDSWNSQYLFLL